MDQARFLAALIQILRNVPDIGPSLAAVNVCRNLECVVADLAAYVRRRGFQNLGHAVKVNAQDNRSAEKFSEIRETLGEIKRSVDRVNDRLERAK